MFSLAVFTSCLVEQTTALRWLTAWGECYVHDDRSLTVEGAFGLRTQNLHRVDVVNACAPLPARTMPPGLRLSLLYSEVDGSNPAVNAVYRVLAICMFGIGLYEIKLPELDERSKVIPTADSGLCIVSYGCD